MTSPVQINMWAGPRNISTTMMRAFEIRSDTQVIDEPFYAYYLRHSGAAHPMRNEAMASLPTSYNDVVALLNQPVEPSAPINFRKHIAFHLADTPMQPVDWITTQKSFLLIRDPRAMVASYAKKFDDVAPITASLEVQKHIYDTLIDNAATCPIVDASDILKNPASILSLLCAALEIPFSEKMLNWPAGPRASDGIWAPHWYDAVVKSTGFNKYQPKEIQLSAELEEIANQCMPIYAELFDNRLTV